MHAGASVGPSSCVPPAKQKPLSGEQSQAAHVLSIGAYDDPASTYVMFASTAASGGLFAWGLVASSSFVLLTMSSPGATVGRVEVSVQAPASARLPATTRTV